MSTRGNAGTAPLKLGDHLKIAGRVVWWFDHLTTL